MKHKLEKKYINNIAVIGGGRWARVIIDSLVFLVESNVKLSVHTPNNKLGMNNWLMENGLNEQVAVYSSLPEFDKNDLSLVIIVNAAHKHESTIKWALKNNYHILVEKPFCIESVSAEDVIEMASSKNLYLATAHVFLFASYVKIFSELTNLMGEIQQIDITWTDPASEKRYGDIKSYDTSLPIYLDWLPHVNSILNTFLDNCPVVHEELLFFNGGSKIKLNSTYGAIKCNIHLQRNYNKRQRIFEVKSANSMIKLDFSEEPGSIHFNGRIIRDLDWENRPRPVKLMLKAFIESIEVNDFDSRLNNTIGLSAIKLTDEVKFLYDNSFGKWLNENENLFGHSMNNDLNYALTELIGFEVGEAFISIEQQVDYVFQNVSDHILNKSVQNKEDDVKDIVFKFINQSKKLKNSN